MIYKILDIPKIKLASINQKYNKNFSLTDEYRNFKEIIFYHTTKIRISGFFNLQILTETPLDIDNFTKPLIDAISTKLEVDDKNLINFTIEKYYCKKGQPGRLVVYLADDIEQNTDLKTRIFMLDKEYENM